MDQALREQLIAMRDEDLRVRQELVASGELGGSYVPRMEAVHIRNAERLEQIITEPNMDGRTSKQPERMEPKRHG